MVELKDLTSALTILKKSVPKLALCLSKPAFENVYPEKPLIQNNLFSVNLSKFRGLLQRSDLQMTVKSANHLILTHLLGF